MSSWSPRRLSAFLLVYAVQVSACGPLDAEEGRLEAKGREDKGRFAELAAGTSLEVQLGAEVSTRSTSVGSPISGFTIRPVVYDGVSLIPAGSEVKGVVTLISKDPPVLSAAFSEVLIGDASHSIRGTVRNAPLLVRSEMKDEAAKIGGGAGAGALLGGVIGGDAKSAAIGAAAGAAAGTGVALATKEKWAVLPAGSKLSVRLEDSLRLPLGDAASPAGWRSIYSAPSSKQAGRQARSPPSGRVPSRQG